MSNKTWQTRVEQVGDEAMIVIPDEVMESMGWKEGDTVDLSVENGGIVIRKIED
ncbi:TPA: AbrB/MazE/SpoVT family DNA-binding domain-containing protein [Enterobacter hormaechei subsp. xiangfangensis]|nr:AbrB/MazE/SpoVT family DNA-binding domain-containing protein [Enterobacter hormaechei subsp. xiangfangensis]HAV1890602.1 AbrB/MazE/SpoVT family DNA-binding domain-containing protein [Enterobacter hormaechei subsp. xiangfangensis]